MCGPCYTLHSEHCLLQAMFAHILLPLIGWNQTPAQFCIHSEVFRCGTLKWILSLVFHYSRPSIFIPKNVYKLHSGIFYILVLQLALLYNKKQPHQPRLTCRLRIKWLQLYQPTVPAQGSIKVTVVLAHCTSNRLNQGYSGTNPLYQQ